MLRKTTKTYVQGVGDGETDNASREVFTSNNGQQSRGQNESVTNKLQSHSQPTETTDLSSLKQATGFTVLI